MNELTLMKTTYKFIKPFIKKNTTMQLKAIGLSLLYRKPVRISFAYLFRIKNGNKFLLVYNNKGKYQPPGGVYQGRKNSLLFNHKKVENDYITGAPENDFRAILKNSFFLSEFYEDFLTGRNREITYDREFTEEILKEKILPKTTFSWKDIEHYKIDEHICVEKGDDVISFYHFDIIEIELNQEQSSYINNMPDYILNKYAWIERKDIKKKSIRLKSVPIPNSIQDHDEIKISNHTHYII